MNPQHGAKAGDFASPLGAKEHGDVAFRAGDFTTAVSSYNDALRLDAAPRGSDGALSSTVLCNRSAAYLKLGRNHLASKDAAAAISLAPASVKAHYRHACALRALGSLDEALAACKAGLAIESHRQLAELAAAVSEALVQPTSTRAPPPSADDASGGSTSKRTKLNGGGSTSGSGSHSTAARAECDDDWVGTVLPPYACPPKPATPAGLYALAELALAARPDPSKVLLLTREFVVAYDVYPKAKVHLLILPRIRLDGPRDLAASHLPLLRSMARLAAWLAAALRATLPAGLAPLAAGFHAVPSMKQLHLHLISLDYSSESLRSKKHWNSFASDFFVPLSRALHSLERSGAVITDGHAAEEAKLKVDMRCPLTGTPLKNVPALKEWLATPGYKRAIAALASRLADNGEVLVSGDWPVRTDRERGE